MVFGAGIVAAAFILSWAAEVAQKDVSQNLALVFFALVAILPEYVVDLYFAWTAGAKPAYTAYALANMTGANRLLIGVGWFLVLVIFFLVFRKQEIELEARRSIDIFWMGAFTLYGFLIFIKGSLSLLDTLILLSFFGVYLYHAARTGVLEPELLGPPAEIARLSRLWRRIVTLIFFLFSAASIVTFAEPFAESLVKSGAILGISEFFLVQWLAPLASEAPEFVVTILLVLKGFPSMALGALISSMVNQWSLLVGAVPAVYSLGRIYANMGLAFAIPLDARQGGEILLTAAQSIFAVSIIINYRFRLHEAVILGLIFFCQLFGTIYLEEANMSLAIPPFHYALTGTYVLLGAILLVKDRKFLPRVLRMTWLWSKGHLPPE